MAKKLYTYLIIALLSVSCSKYGQVTRSGTVEEKYAAALQYYQEKDYYKSTTLLESVLPFISGKEEFDEAIFIFAESYFYQKEYVLASHYYTKFIYKFPRHEKVQLAEYMDAKSQYMQSPKVSLDQYSTKQALDALQTFLNKYPYTQYTEECNGLIAELHQKLVDKSYTTAKLHLKIKNYKAAVKSFEVFARKYPDSDYNEELAFLKIGAQVDLAKISLEKLKKDGKVIFLQKERFEKAKVYYFDFIDSYQGSEYIKDAELLYKTAQNNTRI